MRSLTRLHIPLVLVLFMGIATGMVIVRPDLVRDGCENTPVLQNVFRLPEKQAESAPARLSAVGMLQDLLQSEDAHALVRSYLANTDIDMSIVLESVAQQVLESPEFEEALGDERLTGLMRDTVTEMVHSVDITPFIADLLTSDEFKAAILEALQSDEFRLLYEQMALETLGAMAPALFRTP